MADAERGERIKALREQAHLTQEALADAVGVTLRAAQEWEAGGGVKWANVKKIAKVLHSDPDYVMQGPKPETPDLSSNGSLESRLDIIDQSLNEVLVKLDLLLQPVSAPVAEGAKDVAKAVDKVGESQRKRVPSSPRTASPRKPRAKDPRASR